MYNNQLLPFPSTSLSPFSTSGKAAQRINQKALKKGFACKGILQAPNLSHIGHPPTHHILYITQANHFTYLDKKQLQKMGPGLQLSSKMN